MAINTKAYIERYLKVRNKKSKMVPLVFNEPQSKLYEAIKEQSLNGKPIRQIILKARQLGFSTISEAIVFTNTVTQSNVRSAVIAHKSQSTKMLFNMAKQFYEGLPTALKPNRKYSNDRELVFDKLNSYIMVETAGGKDILRGATLNNLHLSEIAFWGDNAEEQLVGLRQAVPNEPNTMILIESTANGFNFFKKMWDDAVAGLNGYNPIFIGWNELSDYSMKYTGFQLTQEEEHIKRLHGLSNDQLEWRRYAISDLCGGDADLFKQEYPITPEEAFLSTGDCVFNKDKIIDRIGTAPEPIRQGEFIYQKEFYPNGHIALKDIQFVENKKGYIKIYEEVDSTQKYVIGGDTAGEGSDAFEAQGLHLKSGKQVFSFSHLNNEDYFAEQMYCLGKMYNWACIGIENNFSTYPTKQLDKMDYPNQFIRRHEDRAYDDISLQFGVKTTSITRPLFIDGLKSVVNNHIELIRDKDTLRQMLTFVKNVKGRAEADKGKHDDKVMSLGIAFYIRGEELV